MSDQKPPDLHDLAVSVLKTAKELLIEEKALRPAIFLVPRHGQVRVIDRTKIDPDASIAYEILRDALAGNEDILAYIHVNSMRVAPADDPDAKVEIVALVGVTRSGTWFNDGFRVIRSQDGIEFSEFEVDDRMILEPMRSLFPQQPARA